MKKDKETLDIDSDLVSRFSDFATDSSNKIDYAVDNSQTTFKSLKKVGNFSKGLSSIEKGFIEIQKSMQQYTKILNGYYSDLNEMEKKLIEYVDGIKVPDNLRINDSFSVSSRSNVILTKEDGKAVKTGDTVKEEDIKVGDNLTKENISNITKKDVNSVTYDDSSTINKTMLEGVNTSSLNTNNLEEPIVNTEKKNLERININSNTNIPRDDERFIDIPDEKASIEPQIEELEQENDYEVEN